MSGPAAKDLTFTRNSWETNESKINYDVVPKCAAFQLYAHLFSLSDKDYNEWNCKGVDFSILPETFNTIDRLGLSGQEAALSPEISITQAKLLAPDSSLKDSRDSVTFYVDFDYYLRLSLQPRSASGMKAIIKKGTTVVAKGGGQRAKGADVNIGVELKQHQSYTLEVYHYPEDSKQCSTYMLTLEMRLKSAINKTKVCSYVPPGGDIIHEREANSPTYMFEYTNADGVSTQALDPVYSYPTAAKPFSTSVPFAVTSERAVVSGYLQSSFVESGLILEILDSEGVVVKGNYENAHRYELSSVELVSGDYTAVIREATNATSTGLCVSYSAFLLKEDAQMWDSYDSLLRKTKSCKLIDQIYSLNTIGQLEEGKVHWKKEIPMNVVVGVNFYEFQVTEESFIRLQIEEYNDVTFSVTLLNSENEYDTVLEKTLTTAADVFDGIIPPGTYFLEVMFDSETQMPSYKQCPTIELSMTILPRQMYDFYANSLTCKNSDDLPSSLSGSYSGSYKLNSADAVSKQVNIEVTVESEISFAVSYNEFISGAITLNLLDEGGQLIAKGYSVENFCEIREIVPEGSYKVLIETPASQLPGVCFSLNLDYSSSTSDPRLECLGATLPANLWSKETSAFGGPQAKDGQISFYGRFKATGSTTDLIAFKINENSLVRALFDSEVLSMSLSVYDSKYSDKALAYTRKNSDSGSFIIELKPQSSSYILAITYNLQGIKTGCPLFDLKLAIEPIDSAQAILECKAPEQRDYLPLTSIDFSGNQLIKGSFYIFDKWILKGEEELPGGVKSKGKENEPFVFETKVHFNYPGVVSSYAMFDFLTNDISLLLRKEGSVISVSEWGMWAQDSESDILNFSQGFEDVEVEEGDYTLTLKQSVASNHLVQMFDDVDICFPFDFAFEYEADEDSITHNRLLLVEPESLNNFNPINKLSIVLKFEQALKFSTKSLQSLAYLRSSLGTKLTATKAKIDTRHKQHAILEFAEKTLSEGTCYELIFDFSSVPLGDDALPLLTDGQAHVFCTAKCKCNPKASATCDNNLQCVCPFPYTGPVCYDCEEGFQPEKNRCVPYKTEEDTTFSSVTEITPQGTPLYVKKNDEVTVTVTLSGKPHTKKGEYITRKRNVEAIKSTFLLERVGQKSPERYSPYKAATDGEFLKWSFTYKLSDLQEATLYKFVMFPGSLYDAKGRPFKMAIETPSFMIEETDTAGTDCSEHGTWAKTACDCEDGYAGDHCERCEEGWLKDSKGECKFTELDFSFNQPRITSVSPSKAKYQIAKGDPILVVVKLSTPPFTSKKFPINNVANNKHFKEAFYLHRTGKQSDIKVNPKSVVSSKDNLTWNVNFESTDLIEGVYYRLAFNSDSLFDKDGKAFVSEIELPSFGVPAEKKAESSPDTKVPEPKQPDNPKPQETPKPQQCPNGILYKGECVCDIGYTGPSCKECEVGFEVDERGRCMKAQKLNPQILASDLEGQGSLTTTLVNTVLISCFCFFVIYLINKYRQGRNAKNSSLENIDEQEVGIDLHSTQFDNYKFDVQIEDEDDY
mmetsp:Transcript_32826/g.57348  ORF Transcript_32826/g.57348 Transcript_32826/m.57348 type:complete len:1537 (+) Transcript_32826:1757-6367(+)